jgi:cytochrome c-type biogenesis protein CcmH
VRSLLLAGFLFSMLALPCQGKEASTVAEDPVLEKRVMAIAEELRCLVCQNQTIADSQAGLAIDLRNQIRQQIKSGASDDAIKTYMVARYGDFVLYRPPVKASTLGLWFGPFVLLIVGFVFLIVQLKRRRALAASGPAMNESEREQARQILGNTETRP